MQSMENSYLYATELLCLQIWKVRGLLRVNHYALTTSLKCILITFRRGNDRKESMEQKALMAIQEFYKYKTFKRKNQEIFLKYFIINFLRNFIAEN